MADDTDLQAQIAALAGRINRHKTQTTVSDPRTTYNPRPHYGGYHNAWSARQPRQLAPFKNKSLVVTKDVSTAFSEKQQAESANTGQALTGTAATPFIKTHGTNNQLMNASTYAREQKSKSQREHKLNGIDKQHLHAFQQKQKRQRLTPTLPTLKSSRIIQVEGIRFEMKEDGSKLVRVKGGIVDDEAGRLTKGMITDTNDARQTPRSAIIAGITFLRSKNGNLLRQQEAKSERYTASLITSAFGAHHQSYNRTVEPARPQCENFTKNGNEDITPTLSHYRPSHKSTGELHDLKLTYRIGTCKFGPVCRFAHDSTKTAVCKPFLRTGKCPHGEYCDLSHDLTYHRVSACTHFQSDACTNDDCRYPHVRVPVGAPVCRPFATLGYCDDGETCDKRHVFECPDYANTGECPNLDKCPLPHVLRASTERSKTHADAESEVESSSEDELDSISPVEGVVNSGLAVQFKDNDDFISLA